MGSFQDTFETRKRSFISGFSICMTKPLIIVTHIASFNLQNLFLEACKPAQIHHF